MIRRLLLALAALLLAPAVEAQDLARATARVEDLRSIREIKRLQAEWGYRAIAGDWKGMAALGTDYVEMVLPGGNREGREAVENGLRQLFGGADGIPAGRLNLHVWFSPVITLSAMGDRATGRWRHLALLGENGVSATWRSTTDVVEYHKTRDGWRIAFIRPYANFSGTYEEGWRTPAQFERAPFHYTPDEAGILLTGREAARPGLREEIDWEATRLLRESEALNLINAYGYYLDRGMYDDIVDLFADDQRGSDVEIDVAGQGRWIGKDGVRQFLTRFGEPGLDDGELNDRPQLMPLVAVNNEGRIAIVRTVELGMTGQHGNAGYWSAAMQDFVLERNDEGRWLIRSLDVQPIMRAYYEQGWADPQRPDMPPLEGGASMVRSNLPASGYPNHPRTPPDFTLFNRMFNIGLSFGAGRLIPDPDAIKFAEAFDAAENVSNAYGYYIDQFAWRETAALFAADGWKELSYIGTFVGRDQVLASLITRYGENGPSAANQTLHGKTQPYVSVFEDGEHAQVRTRLLQMNSTPTGPGSMIFGIYENQVVKEDGVWRIHGMDLDYTVLADYARGWTGVDPADSRRFAPPPEQLARFDIDAPLRGETFAPYPRIAPMGFHYDNPVTGREPALRLRWSAGYPEGEEPE